MAIQPLRVRNEPHRAELEVQSDCRCHRFSMRKSDTSRGSIFKNLQSCSVLRAWAYFLQDCRPYILFRTLDHLRPFACFCGFNFAETVERDFWPSLIAMYTEGFRTKQVGSLFCCGFQNSANECGAQFSGSKMFQAFFVFHPIWI